MSVNSRKTAKAKSASSSLAHTKKPHTETKKQAKKSASTICTIDISAPEGKITYKVSLPTLKRIQEVISGDESIEVSDFMSERAKETNKPTWAIALRGLRKREGLTQGEFAVAIGLSEDQQNNISAMENGRRSIGKSLAQKIEEKFQVDYRLFL